MKHLRTMTEAPPVTSRWLLAGLIVAFLSPGCATTSTVKHAEGKGTAKIYAYPLTAVLPKTRRALGTLGLQIVEATQSEGGNRASLIAEKGLSAFSYGERVALFLVQTDPGHTSVEVVSKKVIATNIFAKNWTKDIFDTLDSLMAPAGK